MFNHHNSTDLQEDHYRRAMLASGIGMAMIDLEGRWMEVNPALERILGYQAADLVGRAVADQAHPDEVQALRAALGRLCNGGASTLEARQRYLHSDGTIVWAQANVAVVHDTAGRPNCLVVHLRDIGDQHAAEQALHALNRTLEQGLADNTAAMQAINHQHEAFAYGISHDLRAPLRAIESFAALLDNNAHALLDENGRDYLNRIRNAAARMGGLIEALLEFSRVDRAPLAMEPVDVSLLADWVAAELQEAEPARSTDIDVAPGLLAMGDVRQLRLLFTHLVGNAWNFSRDRECVVIQVRGQRDGDRLHITIRDRGSGFDTRYADKMFEPFQRLHGPDQGGGNGLGLAIAKRIVERHGGRIWAESEITDGSTFHLQLPVACGDCQGQ